MKYISIIFIPLILLLSCSDNNNPVDLHEKLFEPTGFVIKEKSMGEVLIYCNKGEIDSSIAERFEFYIRNGERTYDLVFVDEDGNELEEPDVVEYSVIIDKTEPKDLNRKIAAISAVGFDISVTPLHVGTTEFKIILKKNEETIMNSPYMEVSVYK